MGVSVSVWMDTGYIALADRSAWVRTDQESRIKILIVKALQVLRSQLRQDWCVSVSWPMGVCFLFLFQEDAEVS